MDESFGGDFNQTQTATAGAASEQKTEGIAPVLIRQVLESPEGNFKLWDMQFSMVCCHVIVRSIDTSSTKISYLLEDHTGRIEAHFWLEEGGAQETPDVMVNNYATLYGAVRSQGGTKIIMVYNMTALSHPNEITTHILETLYTRYKCEEFATKDTDSTSETDGNVNMMLNGGFSPKQLLVLNAVREYIGEGGISRDDLQRKLNHMTKRELDEIVEFMTNEGHIYSSFDSDHFLATE